MAAEGQMKELSRLMKETGQAHHRAYIETDGYDPEWPLWYAGYMQEKLTPLIGNEMTRSEIVYSLVHLSREQPARAPDAYWPDYYAAYFLEHYAP